MLQSVVLYRVYVGDDRFSALLLFDRVHGAVHMRQWITNPLHSGCVCKSNMYC